jgi:hypothetical protein
MEGCVEVKLSHRLQGFGSLVHQGPVDKFGFAGSFFFLFLREGERVSIEPNAKSCTVCEDPQ